MDIDGDDEEDEGIARAEPPSRRTRNKSKKRAARRVGPTFYIEPPQLKEEDRELYEQVTSCREAGHVHSDDED